MTARLATAALFLTMSVDAFAQDILIVHATTYVSDVQTKLAATGRYTSVDLHNAGSTTPTLPTLQAYDAILVVSDSGFSDGVGLGNVVADYADGGGGVVVCTFAFHSPGGGLTLGGRISTGNYLPFIGAGQSTNPGGFVAAQPAHDILAGVVSFNNGTTGYINLVTLTPGANRVAWFSDGFTELAATMQTNGTRVAGLNFYPPSSTIRADFWQATTDGDLLMANALDWTMTPPCVGGDADGDGVCDADDVCPGFDDRADGDFDGIPDGCDLCIGDDATGDSDLDGYCDDVDSCTGDDTSGDTDGDGVCDDLDACPGGNDAADDDLDGQPNACDPCPDDNPDDTDGDGVCDSVDECPNGDDVLDSDGDGVPDGCDSCPNDAAGDTDGDGICDSLDRCQGFPDHVDGDGDSVPDQCDSCPFDNPDDANANGTCDSDEAGEEGTDLLGDDRTSLGGCLCQSSGGSASWIPLFLVFLAARRRSTGRV